MFHQKYSNEERNEPSLIEHFFPMEKMKNRFLDVGQITTLRHKLSLSSPLSLSLSLSLSPLSPFSFFSLSSLSLSLSNSLSLSLWRRSKVYLKKENETWKTENWELGKTFSFFFSFLTSKIDVWLKKVFCWNNDIFLKFVLCTFKTLNFEKRE